MYYILLFSLKLSLWNKIIRLEQNIYVELVFITLGNIVSSNSAGPSSTTSLVISDRSLFSIDSLFNLIRHVGVPNFDHLLALSKTDLSRPAPSRPLIRNAVTVVDLLKTYRFPLSNTSHISLFISNLWSHPAIILIFYAFSHYSVDMATSHSQFGYLTLPV